MDFASILTYAAAILAIWLVTKILSWPMSTFFKLLGNAIIGLVVLIAINYVGRHFLDFTVAITWWKALCTGLFGIPAVIIFIVMQLVFDI